jgi:hypothetical protein
MKLKDLLKESNVWDREFGQPLPTLKDAIENHKSKILKESPNDLMKELKKVNKVVVKILNKHEKSIGNYMPAVIQKWMSDLHADIKKEGYRV